MIKHVDNEESYRLAQALETAVESAEDFDAMVDKVSALEEENDMLRSDVDEMKAAVRETHAVIAETDRKLKELLKWPA